MRDWLLFGHVLFAIIWMGGAVYVEALTANARRRSDPIALGALFRDTARLNQRLFTASGALVIVFGVWLVLITGSFGMFWIWLSILLVGISVLVDIVYTGPRIRAALELIEERGPADIEALKPIDEVVNAGHVRLGFLMIVLFLMIAKPVL